ncbi:MAG: hypothetical protein MZU97_18375 [Bacillus subtilis]|nr:hypothetical protein [Bacillus subtilis]
MIEVMGLAVLPGRLKAELDAHSRSLHFAERSRHRPVVAKTPGLDRDR